MGTSDTGTLTGYRHQHVVDHIEPSAFAGEELLHRVFVEFVKIQGVDAFVRAEQNVLVVCLGVYL